MVKTHKLPLHTIESAHQFTDNPGEDESNVTIGPKMLKDIIEHFPSVRGNKGDPQLAWGFADSEVIIRSIETSLDTRGETRNYDSLGLQDPSDTHVSRQVQHNWPRNWF